MSGLLQWLSSKMAPQPGGASTPQPENTYQQEITNAIKRWTHPQAATPPLTTPQPAAALPPYTLYSGERPQQ